MECATTTVTAPTFGRCHAATAAGLIVGLRTSRAAAQDPVDLQWLPQTEWIKYITDGGVDDTVPVGMLSDMMGTLKDWVEEVPLHCLSLAFHCISLIFS